MAQLRWLDAIEDPPALAVGLAQLLLTLPSESMRKELIERLPELVDDATGPLLAEELLSCLERGGALVSALLDTLSSLMLTPQQQYRLRSVALELLNSVEAEHCSTVVRHLVQHSDSEPQMVETLQYLRSSVDLSAFVKQDASALALLLQALHHGLSSSKLFPKAVISQLTSLTKASSTKVLDIWLLLLLYSAADWRPRVQSLASSKVTTGIFRLSLLRKALRIHPGALSDCLSRGVIHLAQALLSLTSSSALAARAAHQMYLDAFVLFSEPIVRQDLLGSLLSVVGYSGTVVASPGASDAANQARTSATAALEIIYDIVKRNAAEARSFGAYLRSLIDFLDAGCISTVRQASILYQILAVLAHPLDETENRDCAAFLDILIKKQLNHFDERYYRFGLVAAVQLIGCLGHTRRQAAAVQRATGLLQTVLDSVVRRGTEARQFLFDLLDLLLVQSVQSGELLHPVLIGSGGDEPDRLSLHAYAESQFMESYLTDECCPRGCEDWGDAGTSPPAFVLNVYPLCSNPDSLQRLNYGGGLLRLLLHSVKQADPAGSLDSAGMLLLAPIRLFADIPGTEFASLPDAEKVVMCVALTHSINLARELLNGFSRESGEKYHLQVLSLFKTTMRMERSLNDFLARTPSFVSSAAWAGKSKKPDAISALNPGRHPFLDSLSASAALRQYDICILQRVCTSMLRGPSPRPPPFDSEGDPLARCTEIIREHLALLCAPRKPVSTAAPLQIRWQDRAPAELLLSFNELAVPLGECLAAARKGLSATTTTTQFGSVVDSLSSLTQVLGHPRLLSGLVAAPDEEPHKLATSVIASLALPVHSTAPSSAAAECRQLLLFVSDLGTRLCSYVKLPPQLGIVVLKSAESVLGCLLAIESAPSSARQLLSELAVNFLAAPWEEPSHLLVEILLRSWVAYADDPLAVIAQASQHLSVDSFPALSGGSLWPLWFSTLFSLVARHFSDQTLEGDDGLPKLANALTSFKTLCMLSRSFNAEVGASKLEKGTREKYSVVLKQGKKVVDAVVANVEWVRANLSHNKENIAALITQQLQPATRQLHALCHFVKENTDTQLAKLVPPLKKSLETLLFKMSDILTAVGAGAALSVGNLKFRDHHGGALSSQIPNATD